MAQKTYLNAEEHKQVSEAVAQAELQTAGEIVTVVADRSDGYWDIGFAWAGIAAITALTFLAVFPDFYLGLIDSLLGLWQHDWTAREILAVAVGLTVMKFLGMVAIQLWAPLKFFLIPPPIKSLRVREKAIGFFKVGAERRTHGRTGVLIYLSMREHRAEIVADDAIAEKVSPEVWGEAMADMLVEIKKGDVASGMVAAVRDVGKVLAEHFPRAEDDQNELPDRLIEI
jgi:putative membrane protein